MSIEVISTEYKDGKRVDTVKHTYCKSDEYIRLGQLYYALGQQMAKGEDTKNTALFIEAQITIIKGYGGTSRATFPTDGGDDHAADFTGK